MGNEALLTSLTKSALSGVAWNWGGSAVLAAAQVTSTAATARLVSPKEFGLYATAQAAAGLAGYFTMRAVGQDIQRRSELGPKTVGTALTISLASAGLIGLAVMVAAEPWAQLFGAPEAAPVVRLFAIVVAMTAVSSVPLALLRRRLAFGRAAAVEVTSTVIGLGTGVVLAMNLHSAEALAIGQIVGVSMLAGSATLLTRQNLALSFDTREAHGLATFGGQIGVLGLGSYVANTAPSWFAARVLGPSVLGLYSRAHLIVMLPADYAGTGILKVLFPLYGRVRNSPDRTRALVTDALTLTTGTIWPLFALLAGAAPVIVEVLLGPRWSDAAPYVSLVALGACAGVPTATLTYTAEALGWIKVVAVRLLTFLAAVAAAMAAVFLSGLGLSWLLVGVALGEWTAYALVLRPFVRRELLDWPGVLAVHVIHGAAALGAFALAAACTSASSELPTVVRVAAIVAVGLCVAFVLFKVGHSYPAGRVLRRRMAQAFPRAGWWPGAPRVGAAPR